jgi:hypothetical protein
MNQNNTEAFVAATMQEAADLVERIRPLIAGKPPEVVGAALANLVALLFAGYAPNKRDEGSAVHPW